MSSLLPRICLVPRLSGVGGMVSFQAKLTQGLSSRGIDVCYELDDRPYDAILVIGGTRQIGKLWAARRSGVRIVQRLDGMNWLHRVGRQWQAPKTGTRHYIRSEYGNMILSTIRSRFTDHVIYQSQFSKNWWERVRGDTPVSDSVVHNGVDLDAYSPLGPELPPNDRVRIVLVEGSLMGGYENGLDVAYQLAKGMALSLQHTPTSRLELMIVGRVSPELIDRYNQRIVQDSNSHNLHITWKGQVPAEDIPSIDRSAHILYSSDINAACPNSVIEALACGLPVLAFDTGALPELVTPEAGKVINYGSNPWHLEPPAIDNLVEASQVILDKQDQMRIGARNRALEAFNLEKMVDSYLLHLLN